MTVACRTVLYPVQDVIRATAVFAALLGTVPHVDPPFYVGFSVDGHGIGLIPAGSGQELAGPTPFYDVEDMARWPVRGEGHGKDDDLCTARGAV